MIGRHVSKRNTIYAPLKENANNQAPNSYTITNTGCTQTTGIFGETNGAYDWNGSSNYMNIPTSSLVTSKGCISVWFKKDATNVNQVIVGNTKIGTSDYIQIKSNNGGASDKFRITISDNAYQSATPDDTNWHHAVVNWDSSTTWKGYIDGVLVNTGASGENPANVYYIFLGVQSDGNSIFGTPYYFDGKMTDFKFTQTYNYSLGEIAILYNEKGRIRA